MKEWLWRNIKTYNRLAFLVLCTVRTKLYALEVQGIVGKLLRRYELKISLQLLSQLALLCFRFAFELLGQCLCGETIVINAFDSIVNIQQILHYEDRIFRQKLQERYFLFAQCSQFRHNLHLFFLVFR